MKGKKCDLCGWEILQKTKENLSVLYYIVMCFILKYKIDLWVGIIIKKIKEVI